jgi:dipeptidase E
VALPDPTHRGETRDDRLREFHFFNSQPVVALHEDGMLRVEGLHTTLVGQRDALVFRPGQDIQPISPGPVLDDDLLPP